ncbi:MAG: ribonucleotide-diphosphate reductase subunit beta [Pseudonocardiaceae bacterium]|nr:ribonucleotide-diphosphate reductase subunit beta [Pseudonocardiaceae bacterium]
MPRGSVSDGQPRIQEDEVVDTSDVNETLDEVATRLWRRGVRSGTWDPARIDFTVDRQHYADLGENLRLYLEAFAAAFFQAEENVAKVFGPWVMAAPTFTQQAFLSSQLFEEFKHADFFELAFRDLFGRQPRRALVNPVHDSLADKGDRLLELLETEGVERELAWVEAVAHYQGVIEGVQANAGYQIFRRVFADKQLLPGLAEGYANIQRDEGRHVGYGIAVLRHYAAKDPRLATRIREVFEEFLPLIQQRYGQSIVVDGKTVEPPPEEDGPAQLMKLYERRMRDIFGRAIATASTSH